MRLARDETELPLVDFAGLYRAHAPHVRRFAIYLSGDNMLADDLVSESFVRVYLFAIVRNLFLHHLRHERRRARLPQATVDDQPGPEERASDRSDLRIVLAALAGFPEVDRAALLMRADEGLSYEEIAVALGITVGAAKVKVHRARLKLAEARLAAPVARPVHTGG
jgi:RNA polymerase sigma-70 factor (ECF subfamily)